jgi:uncharacterized repeat protein (TIGR03803 family)
MKYIAFSLATSVALCASRAESQSFTTLVQFTGTGGTACGWEPDHGSLALIGTALYGTTSVGGTATDAMGVGYGNVFSVGTNSTSYKNLISFNGSGTAVNGHFPDSNVALVGTNLYGTTGQGGVYDYGSVFSVGTDGTNYHNLLSFTGSGGETIGEYPVGSLTLIGSQMYGMTAEQGNYFGSVFSVGTNGMNFQNLLSFTGSGSGGAANGKDPAGNLTLAGTRFFGMTNGGGAMGYGNVFSVGTDGTNYQNLVSFTGTGGLASGRNPEGSLTLAGTRLYGMTAVGGAGGYGNLFSVGTDGTGYQNLVSFTGTGGTANGIIPWGSLMLSGTTFYATTTSGGSHESGNIFSVGLDGSSYRDLYDFTNGTDGEMPGGDLLLSGGTLFGTAFTGGANGKGTVFALTLPTPEPDTLALVGAGAAALVSYRWRRGTRAAGRRRRKRR